MARNALVALIKARNILKIYIPYFSCELIFNSILIHCPQTEIVFYNVDQNFMPILDASINDAYIYYINYFGICNAISQKLASNYTHLIIDNAHNFFAKRINQINTIYAKEISYDDFKDSEIYNNLADVKQASNLSSQILASVSYDQVKNIRLTNFVNIFF